ncbi:MAG: hypothetical protein JWN15_4327 [Firmicutes bacterium]|nr:hypothetical protein [Bacillota bacterium]
MSNLAPAAVKADRAESHFRLRAAFLAMFFVFLNFLGVAWDIQWHGDVGPDTFWTLPHIFFYGGTAFAGLICLYVVLITTAQYRKGVAGVNDETTTPWLGLFRAPMGFVITGLGSLTFLISGIYDQWWHSIWGFDVTLVSPPHIGLLSAGLINAVGTVYMFASEGSRATKRGETGLLRPATIGLSMALAALLAEVSHFLVIAIDNIRYIGPIEFYSLLVTMLFGLALLGGVAYLRRPGIATLTALWFTIVRVIALYGTPWATTAYASALNLPFRENAHRVAIVAVAMPALLIVPALILDLLTALAPRLGLRPRVAAPLALVFAMVVNFLVDRRLEVVTRLLWPVQMQPHMLTDLAAHTMPTLLGIVVAGIIMGWGAWNFGVTLRYTDK